MIMTRRPGFASGIVVAFSALCLALPLVFPGSAEAVRIKDIATFSGVRSNQLVGYGLVVGLGNTGDTKDSFTRETLVNMMERMGVAVDSRNLKAGNVASVMVTANLPVSAKAGSNIDVTVSSIGNATSLQGGVLLQTPLKGVDGKIYRWPRGRSLWAAIPPPARLPAPRRIRLRWRVFPAGPLWNVKCPSASIHSRNSR